jgi:hypothetical protein
MIFEIHAERSAGDKKIFYYDNVTNTLKREDGVTFEFPEGSIHDHNLTPYKSVDKNTPLIKTKTLLGPSDAVSVPGAINSN